MKKTVAGILVGLLFAGFVFLAERTTPEIN